jgi:ATP-dependent Lhr-like helicase
MWFAFEENEPTGKETLPDQIPWQLLHAIAIIQLYLEERWIEPIRPVAYPFSLLYHQTMSILASVGELSPAALAERVLTLPPFHGISQEDYKALLLHLIQTNHIQQTEERGLIVGLAGEPVVRNFRFYAVFPDSNEFSVKSDSKEIGSITMPPPVGERFALAGRTWEVLEIDIKRRIIYAKRVKGKVPVSWYGGIPGDVHTRILQRMRMALFEDAEYSYLLSGAKARLKEARGFARHAALDKHNAVALGGDTVGLFPWMGLRAFDTLERCLRHQPKPAIHLSAISSWSPYFITLKMESANPGRLTEWLKSLANTQVRPRDLVTPEELPGLCGREKYTEFVPESLLLKAFAHDGLDVEETQALLNDLS